MLTSASNKICKKAIEVKQGNNCQKNVLVNADDKIGLRGARLAQDTVNSCKKTAEAVWEVPVMEVRQARVLKANRDGGTAAPSKRRQLVQEEAPRGDKFTPSDVK